MLSSYLFFKIKNNKIAKNEIPNRRESKLIKLQARKPRPSGRGGIAFSPS